MSYLIKTLAIQVRCWEVEQTGKTIPKSIQNVQAPVLDVAWYDVSNSHQFPHFCRRMAFYLPLFVGWNESIHSIG